MVKKQDNLVLHLADYIPGVSEDVARTELLSTQQRATETFTHCCWECRNGTTTLGNSLFPIKLNSHDPVVSVLDIYSRQMRMYIHTKPYARICTRALYISVPLGTSQMSTSRSIDHLCYISIIGHYAEIRNKLLVPTAT